MIFILYILLFKWTRFINKNVYVPSKPWILSFFCVKTAIQCFKWPSFTLLSKRKSFIVQEWFFCFAVISSSAYDLNVLWCLCTYACRWSCGKEKLQLNETIIYYYHYECESKCVFRSWADRVCDRFALPTVLLKLSQL